ncbi:MAG: AMP-binding protein [Acidimicrobiales bacterium]
MSVTASPDAAPTATAAWLSEGSQGVAVDSRRHATTWLRSDEPDSGFEIVRTWDGAAWAGWTRAELAARVRRVAGALVAAGVAPGDRVVVMGRTRLESTVADLAILSAGAVTIPVYETSTAEQCGYVLASCGANQGLSRAEALDRGLTLEDGELAPTLKLRRGVVAEHFAGVIASLYAPRPGTTQQQEARGTPLPATCTGERSRRRPAPRRLPLPYGS